MFCAFKDEVQFEDGVLLVETLYGLFLKAFQISALKSHFLIKRFVSYQTKHP
uniref:Uncharacterized protein n=1 Tax=Anguilla anguilla TaxID=7936 RepID=A0A0E9SKA4_ANGAN